MNKHLFLTLFFIFSLSNCAQAQTELLGAPCEGCEAVFEYGNKHLNPVDTLPDFHKPGPKLKVTGIIYKNDGKTPAANVILYIYHTNQEGIYPTRGDETGWARRDGYIRGWIKTDSTGRYTFYTLKPGTYPDRSEPAHIHPVILEPDGDYYYIDNWNFANDPLLADDERSEPAPRGGSGIVALKEEGDLLIAERDIILGLNIPNYPDND